MIQREIEDRLASLLLAGEVKDGSFVRADVQEDGSGLKLVAESVS